MRILGLCFVAFAVATFGACNHNANEPTREEVNPLRSPTGAMAKNDITRGAQKQIHQNSMVQIKLFYTMYYNEQNRPPANLEEFLKFIERDAHLEHELLKEGHVVLVLNVTPTSENIIAYEKEPYQKWMNRLVAFGDRVETMSEADFQAAKQRQGLK
jgi:hypothetical protein